MAIGLPNPSSHHPSPMLIDLQELNVDPSQQ
jgi:hypothetical protein